MQEHFLVSGLDIIMRLYLAATDLKMFISAYEVLGVHQKAQPKKIRDAFGSLMALHPAKVPENKPLRAQYIAAYQTLCYSRAAHDVEIAHHEAEEMRQVQLQDEAGKELWRKISYEDKFLTDLAIKERLYGSNEWRQNWSQAANIILNDYPRLAGLESLRNEAARVIILGIDNKQNSHVFQLTQAFGHNAWDIISFVCRRHTAFPATLQETLRLSVTDVDDPNVSPQIIKWAKILNGTMAATIPERLDDNKKTKLEFDGFKRKIYQSYLSP